MNTSNGPSPSDSQEPITHLLREACGLADEAAERIPDSAVNARLNSVLRKAGYTSGAEHEASQAEILAVARGEAEEILAAARRGAAEATAEAACAEAAAQAARREAEHATAQAEQYQDAALKKAASIVAEARIEASRIIEEAWAEVDRIAWSNRIARNRGRQYVPARPTSPAHGNGMRSGSRQLRDVQDLIAKLEDVDRKLALPIRAISMDQPVDAEPADVTPPLPEGAASRVAS
jgi:hypothetical protein